MKTNISVAPNVSNDYARFRSRRQQMPVEDIVEDIQQTAALPLPLARTIPAEAYTSDAFFEWELENVLRKDWVCVAHLSQLPNAGDFLNLDLLDEPVIVVHGKDGVVRTLSRVCPHRAMDIMPPGFEIPGHNPAEARPGSPCAGHTRIFMCPYHAWTFELDGKLKGSPEMHEAQCFDRSETSLRTFRTEVWQGFVFVNFDGEAPPLSSLYNETMAGDLASWNPAEMQVIYEEAWDCEFNWKVLVENFSECYHHIGTHAKTLQPIMPAKECWTEEERAGYIREHLPLRESAIDALKEAMAAGVEFPFIETLSERSRAEWGLFIGFPSFLLFSGPNQLVWYRIDPLTPDRSRLLTSVLVPKSFLALPQFEKCKETASTAMVEFHKEDMDTCAAVQRGLYASGYQRGRMSHLEMPIWLFHRYLAARSKGLWPTQEMPAAPSQNGRIGAIPA